MSDRGAAPSLPADALAHVERVIAERRHLAGALLPILHGVQDALGHVPDTAVPVIAQALNLSRAEVHGLLTYYTHFRRAPLDGPLLQLCRAESCQAMGADALWRQAQGHGRCHVEAVYCLGLCAMSPAALLDGAPHARLTTERLQALLDR